MIWLNLAGNILWQMVYMLFSPLFWLVVALVWWQNKRLSKQKSSLKMRRSLKVLRWKRR